MKSPVTKEYLDDLRRRLIEREEMNNKIGATILRDEYRQACAVAYSCGDLASKPSQGGAGMAHRLALTVATAWLAGIGDSRWYCRRNNEHANKKWEVVHDAGGSISDQSITVVSRHDREDDAQYEAKHLERIARAEAVLAVLAELGTLKS